MSVDLTAKRKNWIARGYHSMNGTSTPGSNPARPGNRMFFGIANDLQAWVAEGVANGFIPATAGETAANTVVDADFAAWPSVNAAAFLTGIAAWQALLPVYATNYPALLAMAP